MNWLTLKTTLDSRPDMYRPFVLGCSPSGRSAAREMLEQVEYIGEQVYIYPMLKQS